MSNQNLINAKKAKNDEFYTQYEDVENEIQYYVNHFENKTVLCNCNDTTWSAFHQYFKNNFGNLKLKKLICLEYDRKGIRGKAYISKLDADKDFEIINLFGCGSFNDDEGIEFLKEADIVCTNPPFSKWREYFDLLMRYNKKFIIIGNLNAVSYKNVFPYIKDGKVWGGATMRAVKAKFVVPENNIYNDRKRDEKDGKLKTEINNAMWFTNLEYKKRHEDGLFTCSYYPGPNQKEYPKYDNYDAIEVSKAWMIPCDYEGVMGVPISFLNKLNPDQFEIVGYSCGFRPEGWKLVPQEIIDEYKKQNPQKASMVKHDTYYIKKDGTIVVPYGRLLIKHKHPQPKFSEK